MRHGADVIGSVFLILVGTGAVFGGISLTLGTVTEPQPGFFPFLGGATLIALSAILLVQAVRGRTASVQGFGELGRPALLIAAMLLYVAVLEALGYLLATLMLAAGVLRILNVRSWPVVVLVSLFLSAGTYVLFDRLLGVLLPPGILGFAG